MGSPGAATRGATGKQVLQWQQEISWKNPCAASNPDPQGHILKGLGSCFPRISLEPPGFHTPHGSGALYLGIEGVFEDLTQSFCIDLRLPRLRGVQDGGLDPLGHGLAHQLG